MVKGKHYILSTVLILVLFTITLAGCITITPGGDASQNEQEQSSQQAEKPLITQFSASPSNIAAGQSTTISWTVSNSESVTIEPGIGNVALSGSTSVSPSTTMQYTITATNSAGSSVATTVVSVTSAPEPVVIGTPPEIGYFTATPNNILLGGSSTLSWSVSNASSVEISSGVGVVAFTGTLSVSPITTTTYIITATNSYGWRSQTVTISVSTLIPDLVAKDIHRESYQNYTAVVKNKGAIASGPFQARLKSLNQTAYETCPPIEPGGTRNILFSFFPPDSSCGGTVTSFKITLFVDSTDDIGESDEGNNKCTRTFMCP